MDGFRFACFFIFLGYDTRGLRESISREAMPISPLIACDLYFGEIACIGVGIICRTVFLLFGGRIICV